MRFTVNIECTPEEARRFFGAPDVAPMQDALMEEMQKQFTTNIQAFGNGNILRPWLTLNMEAFQQFQKLFTAGFQTALPANSEAPERKRA